MATTQSELTQPNQSYVTYDNYTTANLTCTPHETKTVPDGPSKGTTYYQIPFLYNYGTAENKRLTDFLLEGCELSTSFGVQSKPNQSGRVEHSIMVSFDVNDDEQVRFIETINQVHAGAAYILQQMKGAVKLFNFNAQMAEATGLKNPIYRPRDEVTGEILQGRKPSNYFKLFQRGKPPMVEQTLFTDLNGKPIPWALLQGVEMKFIPLIHFKRIYVGGGKASIQMEVVSAIVTSIRARNTATQQLSTIHRLQHTRPELVDTVAAQLAKLTTDRQDQMLGASVPQSQDQQGGEASQPTFAGIAPTGRIQAQLPSQSGTGGMNVGLPPIPPLGSSNSMQDFTATAPARLPQGVALPQQMTSSTLQLN
jgi:hypothetical protein